MNTKRKTKSDGIVKRQKKIVDVGKSTKKLSGDSGDDNWSKQLTDLEQNIFELIGSLSRYVNMFRVYYDLLYNRDDPVIVRNIHSVYFGSHQIDTPELLLEHSYVLLKKSLDMENVKISIKRCPGGKLEQKSATVRYVSTMELILVKMVMENFISDERTLTTIAREIYKDILKIDRVDQDNHIFQFDFYWRQAFITRNDLQNHFKPSCLDSDVDYLSQLVVDETSSEEGNRTEQEKNEEDKAKEVDGPKEFSLELLQKSITLVARVNKKFPYIKQMMTESDNPDDMSWNNTTILDLNFDREQSCDCMEANCPGCYLRCFECGSRQCETVCRKSKQFHMNDIFNSYKYRKVALIKNKLQID